MPSEKDKELVDLALSAIHNLEKSHVFVGIVDDRKLDLKKASVCQFLLQIGYSVMHDKLIVIPVPHGVEVPKKLEAVADAIVRYDPDNPASMHAGMTKALTEIGINKH